MHVLRSEDGPRTYRCRESQTQCFLCAAETARASVDSTCSRFCRAFVLVAHTRPLYVKAKLNPLHGVCANPALQREQYLLHTGNFKEGRPSGCRPQTLRLLL
jgi:hypothetical protein